MYSHDRELRRSLRGAGPLSKVEFLQTPKAKFSRLPRLDVTRTSNDGIVTGNPFIPQRFESHLEAIALLSMNSQPLRHRHHPIIPAVPTPNPCSATHSAIDKPSTYHCSPCL